MRTPNVKSKTYRRKCRATSKGGLNRPRSEFRAERGLKTSVRLESSSSIAKAHDYGNYREGLSRSIPSVLATPNSKHKVGSSRVASMGPNTGR